MANEAVIIELLGNKGDPVRYTVPDQDAYEKGTIVKIIDPRTISGSITSGAVVAGITAAEKVAGDGSTTLAVYTNGIFDLRTENSITAGNMVTMSGVNLIQASSKDEDTNNGLVIGQALESASSGTPETIAVRVLL